MTMNWGTGVAAAYLVFAAATGGFVVFAMSRPVSLVRPDYYAESLREDQRLAARRNAQALGSAVAIQSNGHDGVHISIPIDRGAAARGSVTFYRASDATADRTVDFAPDERGQQDVRVGDVARGLWLVQLRWSVGARDYYLEQPVILK